MRPGASLLPAGEEPSVYGVKPDAETRCAHYGGPLDRVAIRFRCCNRYYCCHACHEALEGHRARPWRPGDLDRRTVLCGACRFQMTTREYLGSGSRCPRCEARFNPRCARHRHLYFAVADDQRLS